MVSAPLPAGGETKSDESATSLAIRRYEERLAKDPDSLAFAPLADAHRKAGRVQEAISLCREGLARFPEYATARLILAKALLDAEDPEGALAEVHALLKAHPADAQAHRLAADLERRAGRYAEALGHFRQAATLDPFDRESRVLAEALEGGVKRAGVSPLARLLEDESFATVSFGTVCLEQGLVDEAAHVFLRVLGKEPGHPTARARLEETLRIKTQKRKGS